MDDNTNIKVHVSNIVTNNCTKREARRLFDIFRIEFISWVSSPHKKYRYELEAITSDLKRPSFKLLIRREAANETNTTSDMENYDYYVVTFKNEETGTTFIIRAAVLFYETTEELYQPE